MRETWLRKFSRRAWQSKLALAVTAGIMAGVYLPGSAFAAQSTTEFTTAIGDTDTYAGAGVYADNTYTFTEDTTIKVAGSQASTSSGSAISGARGAGYAINVADGKTLTIDVKNSSGRAEGMSIGGQNSGSDVSNVVVKGNVKLDVEGSGYSIGVYSGGTNDIEFNGDLSITLNKVADTTVYGFYEASGLYVGSNYSIQKGGVITVNGDVDFDIQAEKGNGVLANGGGSTINLQGGEIVIADNAYSALHAESATVNMNMNDDLTAVGTNAVTLVGNLAVTNGAINPAEPCKTTTINLGLNGEDSTWKGIAYSNFTKTQIGMGWTGEINLFMDNGAVWTNEAHGSVSSNGSKVESFVGSSTAANAPYIIQKDSKALTINNYSGNAVVVYEHEGDGSSTDLYTAGDTVIKHAEGGSGIVLSTDNSGIDMQNSTAVSNALNALAGKLTYSNYVDGERNLTGKVQIASGLTSSATVKQVLGIKFNEATGKGNNDGADQIVDEEEFTGVTYTSKITGKAADDTEYQAAGVIQDNGTYKFTQDTMIDCTETAAIVVRPNTSTGATIDAQGHTLILKTEESAAIDNDDTNTGEYTGKVDIKADKIKIETFNTGVNNNSTLHGITFRNGTDNVINGDVSLSAKYTADSRKMSRQIKGINVSGISDDVALKIDGDLTIKADDGSWGVTGLTVQTTIMGRWGIYAAGNSDFSGNHLYDGDVTITGNVDLLVDGIAVSVKDGHVNIDGGGIIKVNKDAMSYKTSSESLASVYAVYADQHGTFNMNVKDAAAGDKDVNIEGNIYNNTDSSIINLGLATKDSSFDGIVNSVANGATNIWLQNDATWTNESYGLAESSFTGSKANIIGGSTAATAGNIIQKDSNQLTINQQNGYTNIFYAHDAENTTSIIGGDTIVKSAGEGAHINLLTDNSGLYVESYRAEDKNKVHETLEALAQKLVYSGYLNNENNLTASVGIASGLTASAVTYSDWSKSISFDDEEGRGVYNYTPVEDTTVDYTSRTLNGDVDEAAWLGEGVVSQDADGNITYNFTETETKITAPDRTAAISTSAGSMASADEPVNVVINANQLNLVSESNKVSGNSAAAGIDIDDGDNMTINGDVSIEAHNSTGNFATGISVSRAGSGTGAQSSLTINGDVTMRSDDTAEPWGVTTTYAGQHGGYGPEGSASSDAPNYTGARWSAAGIALNMGDGSSITINGDVDLAVKGTAVKSDPFYTSKTVTNDEDLSVINLNGNVNILTPEATDESYYSLANYGGTINVNMDGDAAGDNTVTMVGNVITMVEDNGSGGAFFYRDGVTNIGLKGADSYWYGVIDNSGSKQAGAVNVYLSEDAAWYHESMSKTDGMQVANMPSPSNNQYGKYDGVTHVNSLVGGSFDDDTNVGVIYQNDSATLDIKNYSGNTKVIYAHTGDGSNTSDYTGGDVVINNVDNAGRITLVTGNNGIEMTDTTSGGAVESALNGLAGKLSYLNHVQGEKRLEGIVQIASGMTAPAARLLTASEESSQTVEGYINFDGDGQGHYQIGNSTAYDASSEDLDPTDNSEGGGSGSTGGGSIVIEDDETLMMRGARSAMTTSMLAWRDNASDINYRVRQLRDGEERGTWAQVYGGKTKYEGGNTDMDNSYWAGAVGVDRQIHGWTVGAMVNYQKGDSNYILGGEGDNEMYSAGIYGSTEIGKDVHLDVAAKAGHVKNEYTVYNEIGSALEGDFSSRGYGLSAQISKRFGDSKRYLEPQVQLTWSKVDGDSYNAYSGDQVMNIDQDSFTSLVGRIGLETGMKSDKGSMYARLSLAHEFDGDINGTYTADDGGTKSTKYDVAGTWSELTLGGTYKLGKTSSFYADITRSLSGDYEHEWKLNAGLNFTF